MATKHKGFVRKYIGYLTVIISAIVLGITSDRIGFYISSKTTPFVRVFTQISLDILIVLIIGFTALKQRLTTNIFFVSVFLGVQQSLFNEINTYFVKTAQRPWTPLIHPS